MKKVWDFLQSNKIIVQWTFWYFFVLWLILKFVFNFDMFSLHYWWKFFHATLHGFGGFVFGAIIYSAIPIYIATVKTIYKTKEPIIKISLLDKISELMPAKQKSDSDDKQESVSESEEPLPAPEYPDDLPAELRIPFMRAKNNVSLTGAVSVYNKQKAIPIPNTPEQIMNEAENFMPLPTDFDIPESVNNNNFIPTFTDINFDEPKTPENNTTKYLKSKNIEFEVYKNFVATEKYLIYEHNDEDFWIMDGDIWFATGKQIDSPIYELIDTALQNELTPVIYLHSQNIMDIENTIKQFESANIRVVKSLDELW